MQRVYGTPWQAARGRLGPEVVVVLWWLLATLAWSAQVDLRIVAHDFDLSANTERSVRRVLTRMFRTYEDTLGLDFRDPTPVHIRLIADRGEYRRQAVALGLTGPTLGFFSPRRGEGVVWRNQSESAMHATLVHEASHYLMAVGGAGLAPQWLHEGMAELFEGARLSGNAVYLDPPPRLGAWLRAHEAQLPPLGTLLTSSSRWGAVPLTPVGPGPYGVGWSVCAFLFSSSTGKGVLRALLAAPRGRIGGALATYPGGVEALDRDWRAWIRRGPRSMQLPITSAGSDEAEGGWVRCADGRLIREGHGLSCGLSTR